MTRKRIDLDVDRAHLTGLTTDPGMHEAPLVVAIHGGAFTARYFDVPGLSLLDLAAETGFTAITLNRPGYGDSDPLPEGAGGFENQARRLDQAIARIWEQQRGEHPGIVIVAHSIGAAISMHLAALQPQWPLLGLAVHGVGDSPADGVGEAFRSVPAGQAVTLSTEQRRMLLYGPGDTRAPDAITHAAVATAPLPLFELVEIGRQFSGRVPELAAEITVPVHYRLAEFDRLWTTGHDRVEAFSAHFRRAPSVDASLFPGAGHCIDHHRLGRSLHLQQLAFAWACAHSGPPDELRLATQGLSSAVESTLGDQGQGRLS